MTLQLDNNRISIRERNMLEIFDLALQVVRAAGLPLLAMLALGIVPMLLLGVWLFAEMTGPGYIDESEPAFQYMGSMLLYVAVTMPLAAAPATLYLGKSMFEERPSLRSVLTDLRHSLPQLIWFQILLRGTMIWLGLIVFDQGASALFNTLGVFILLPFFIAWPYLNEVILLERNPLFSKRGKRMTTLRRTFRLHTSDIGDLLVRWMAALVVGLVLVLSIWASLYFLLSQLSGTWHSSQTAFLIYLPLGLWITMGYFTIVRFLCYLDLRIRREGWEVELAIKAEKTRLLGKAA